MNSGKWGSKLKHWALLLLFLSHTTCLPLTPAPSSALTLTAHNQYLNLSLEVESINAPLILLIGPWRFDDPPERKQYVPLFQGILGRNMYFSIFPVCYFWDIGTGADLLANNSDRQVQKTESVGNCLSCWPFQVFFYDCNHSELFWYSKSKLGIFHEYLIFVDTTLKGK